VLPDGQYNSVVWNPELEMFVVVPNPPPKPPAPGQTLGPGEYGSEPKSKPPNWKPWAKRIVASIVLVVLGAAGGVWSAGGIEIGPGPGPSRNDVLQQCYEADRISQAAILREYAAKGFANDTAGRLAATEWFNNNRFRNRATDFRPYTTAVVDHFAAGTLTKFAEELEGK
jgi:hypothetical protein